MELRWYQSEAVEAAWKFMREKPGNPVIELPTGAGKCLGRDTPVMKHDGTVVAVQDVRAGDRLMGPDSRPRTVLGVTTGRGPLYRVTPTKGAPYVVNGDHVLSLKLTPEAAGDGHELVNVSVREYLAQSATFKHRAKGWRTGVDFPARPVPIDPYYLGLWLADGSSTVPSVTKPDPEVEATVRAYAGSLGLGVRVSRNSSGCPTFHATAGRFGKRKGRNPLLAAMQNAGLVGNKHVPREYLVNDRNTRLKLLAGLLDGDGCLSRSGYDFSSINKDIADGVAFLARSLGLAAYITPRTTHCQRGTACESFRVSISGDCSVVPVRIARRVAPPRRQIKDVLVTGVRVDPVGDGEYFGFELDGDHLFLLGDFTVTHNSLVIAELTRQAVQQWNGRVLILQHVKELIEQNAAKLQALCPTIRVGLYSAGLKRRETDSPVIVAGVQSVYDKADRLGRFDLVLIDEGHLVPESGDGMYRQLIRAIQEANPDLVVIGLTATPYRTGDGPLCSAEGLLNAICYSVKVTTLIAQGFLSRLIGRRAEHEIDTTGIHVRAGEFVEGEVEDRMAGVVQQAADEVVHQCRNRKACLVFCQTVAHAEQVAGHVLRAVQVRQLAARLQTQPAADLFDLGADELAAPVLPIVADWLDDNGKPTDHLRRYLDTGRETVAVLTGGTPSDERARLIEEFRGGRLKYLVNVNVLTTGFDAPNVDCVAILRATLSPGLFYQMVGRGFRLCDGKDNCLVLDFGGNIQRHGPVDDIKPRKAGDGKGEAPPQRMCPACRAVVGPTVRVCPGCGAEFVAEPREPSHNGTADGDPLGNGATEHTHAVSSVEYRVHTKRDAPDGAPKTLRVTYKCGLADYVSEWVCVEHPEGGFAHQKAAKWWRKRCRAPMPATAAEAVVYATLGLLAEPTEITTRTKKGEKFPEIVKQAVGPVPDEMPVCTECGGPDFAMVPNEGDRYRPGKIVCGACGHLRGYACPEVCRLGFFDPADPRPLLPDEVYAAYEREGSDPPRDSEETRSFDLLSALESVGGMGHDNADCPF